MRDRRVARTPTSACSLPSPVGSNRAVRIFVTAIALATAGLSDPAGAQESNFGHAFRWYLEAAEDGDAEAQFMLAMQYEQGLRVEGADLEKAEYWYRQAAEGGYPLAQFRLALVLQQPADAEALAEAVTLMQGAAAQGLADAQFNLAIAYEAGRGVAADEAAAIAWYRRAGEQGLPEAWYNLGGLLATGASAPLDDVEAYMWLELAAGADIAGAADLRDRLAERMTEALIAEALDLATARRDAPAVE